VRSLLVIGSRELVTHQKEEKRKNGNEEEERAEGESLIKMEREGGERRRKIVHNRVPIFFGR